MKTFWVVLIGISVLANTYAAEKSSGKRSLTKETPRTTEQRNESLKSFHSTATAAIARCVDANGQSVKEIETEVRIREYRANLDDKLISEAFGRGMISSAEKFRREQAARISQSQEKVQVVVDKLKVDQVECADKSANEIKQAYSATIDAVPKSTDLTAAFKEYATRVLSMANSSKVGETETLEQYKERIRQLNERADESWNKVVLEAAI